MAFKAASDCSFSLKTETCCCNSSQVACSIDGASWCPLAFLLFISHLLLKKKMFTCSYYEEYKYNCCRFRSCDSGYLSLFRVKRAAFKISSYLNEQIFMSLHNSVMKTLARPRNQLSHAK